MAPAVGELIDGRYQIEQLIGRGGMGSVWRARHVFTNVRVALKLLEDEYDAVAFERFLAEARAASTIGHPAIVVVSDANRMTNNQLYLAMELLVGKPLRVAMAAGLGARSTEDPGELIRRIGLEVLDALAAAHSHGIIHRDLKPENIFLVSPNNGVKLLDFGIAKVLGGRASRAMHSGGVLGTLEYMAPEQLVDASTVDGRADLWAIAITLYEMIAGMRPYGGTTPAEKYHALMNEEPVPIDSVAKVPRETVVFFERALARDRDRRFATAAQMAAALRTVPVTAHARPATGPGPTLGTGEAWIGPKPGSPTLGTGEAWIAPRPGSIPPGDSPSRSTPQSMPPDDLPTGAPTRVTPQYYAPSDTAGATDRPRPNLNVSTSAPAPRKSRAVPFAIAGVAVVALAVTIVVVGRGPDPKHVTTADGGVVQVAPTAPDRCTPVCKKLAGCNLAQDSCKSDCNQKFMSTDCIEKAKDCVEASACIWKWTCAAYIPSGNTSCAATLNCHQTQCGGKMNNPCLCLCNAKMSPASGLIMAKLMTCRLNIGEDMDRFRKECFQQYAQPCIDDR